MAWIPSPASSAPRNLHKIRTSKQGKSSECHSTRRSSALFDLHEGQDLATPTHHQPHMRHLRDNHCTCSWLLPEHAYGVKPRTSADGQSPSVRPRNTCSTKHLQENLVGVRLLREDGLLETKPSVLPRPRTPVSARATCRLPHDRRHHRALNRSPASSYREPCRSAGGRERCSASWKAGT